MITVLGPLAVHGDGPVDVGSPRHREVLAALVVDAGRVVSTDALLERVWGDGARGGTTANLHAIISRLRARLRDGTGIEIATAPPGYRLDAGPGEVDAVRFLDLLAAARAAQAAGETEAARQHVADGLGLWRGAAYADIPHPFAEAEAARLDGQRLAAEELAGELDLALGHHEPVLDRLPALVAQHPLRESLRALLMRALYRAGRQADALAVYAEVREVLADELGLDPGPELQQLHQRILEHDQSLLVERPAPAPAVPARPAAAEAPATGGLRSDVVPPSSPLLGREQEVAYVRSLLEGSTQRLVTLTGVGGVGKTRLAHAVAEAAAASYRDGAVVVSLAPLSDPATVLPEVGRATGLSGVEGLDPVPALVEHLRGQQLLLVLDNLEHLLDAAAPLSRLVASCPELTVLVTSRTTLRVRGEVQYQVPPLPLPEPQEADPEVLADSAAVALFVDRAAAVAPSFALEPGNAAAVGSICRRLAGIPLAIELAAARVRLMPPAAMLARLEEVMAAGGARDLPPRQRTMRTAIDWSHELLEPAEQELFRRLSVFAGGFTLDAVEAVADDLPGVLGLLESLVEHSLVLPDADHPDLARFRMLEPISQYADGLLRGEERAASRQAHRRYFRDLAGRLEPAYRGPGTIGALAVAEREHANFVAALDSGIEDGDGDLAGWLAWDLWLFWWLRGALLEGRRICSALLGMELSDPVRVRTSAVLAAMAFAGGDLRTAREYWESGNELGERTGDLAGRSHNLAGVGLVALGEGDLDGAVRALEDTIPLCEEAGLGGAWMWTLAHVWLGTVALLQGDLARAAEKVDLALAAAHERQDPLAIYITLFTAAQVALATHDPATARRQLEEGIRLSLDTGDMANLAYFLDTLGVVDSLAGAHRRVAVLHGAAQRLRETVGANVYGYYKPDEAMLAQAIDGARAALGAAFDEAVAAGRRMGMPEVVAFATGS
ncbi:BTAD domain-containing putative transcriptional regulator [Nocardioides sp. SYSU D00038]|uniref:BTAD domain-containing putative transcriptional regulator n=1 Tax=Nocardioides sp. SYSU D00038 TaxID=2812554 RepID=UPI001967A750|nr:BTAD domain-containing putative transcriptional regulator [Nocardioides sp. SYSU D00038]